MAGEEVSGFRGALEFFGKIGIYDVVLPFILIFTIVFAILEKTKVFGTEKIGGETYTRKNLNAMTSFVIAFFVIASSQLVETITKISANVVLLLMGSVLFLLLVGSFHEETEKGFFLKGGWQTTFIIIMFVGLIVIFLDAIKTGGKTWLQWVLDYVGQFWSNDAVASIIMILVLLGFFIYVTRSPTKEKKGD